MSRHVRKMDKSNTTDTLVDVYEMIVSLEPMPEEDPRHPNGHAMRRFRVAEAFVKLALSMREKEIVNHFRELNGGGRRDES